MYYSTYKDTLDRNSKDVSGFSFHLTGLPQYQKQAWTDPRLVALTLEKQIT